MVDNPFIIPEHEHSATDMLSDWLQAKKAVLWDCRADAFPQLQSRGLTMEELEDLLLALAADVHEKRTGMRAGAIIVEDGVVHRVYQSINHSLPIVGDRSMKPLEEQLERLVDKRGLR